MAVDEMKKKIKEVLSPSSRRKDVFIKGEKYANAGVKEYWITDDIPVAISKGKFHVDFRRSIRILSTIFLNLRTELEHKSIMYYTVMGRKVRCITDSTAMTILTCLIRRSGQGA